MKNKASKHLHDQDETYFKHLKLAACFALRTLAVGFAFLIHAVFPFWFEDKGSKDLEKIVADIKNRK